MDRLFALKVFCVAAETLQFKETARRLAVSAPVITRSIAELEKELGEPLFIRNTRQVILSDFGQRFLRQAQTLLNDSEQLFQNRRNDDEMQGVVRIAMPVLPYENAILAALLTALAPYPDIIVDWQVGGRRLNVVENQIDVGMRIGFAADSTLIAKKIGQMHEKIVVAPALLAKLGQPADLNDFKNRYPLAALADENTGKAWAWHINDDQQIITQPRFSTPDQYAMLTAVRSGRVAGHLLDCVCQAALASGDIVELFADIPKIQWPVYIYRQQQTATPARVKFVFDELVKIAGRQLK
ncbi:MAG: LysR family transcriptional regulator [Neisseria sp.]|nr:LysR family transcriptional regulator [Neisseria sp.]